jgi:hypothetical protein
MATTAIATLQTIWDCKWSRPGYRLFGVEDQLQPEQLWVCVRTERRSVTADECATCPYWEADPARPEAHH